MKSSVLIHRVFSAEVHIQSEQISFFQLIDQSPKRSHTQFPHVFVAICIALIRLETLFE